MSAVPRGPEEHKAAARRLVIREPGKRPRVAAGGNLTVLATANDPFYCGMPAQVAEAQWFAGIWAEHGGPGAHIRHVHYRAFTAGAALLDGSRYPNDDRTWMALGQAAIYARYLGLVDPELLSDQRNDQPVIGARPRIWEDDEPAAELDGDPDWPELPSIRASLPQAYPYIPPLEVTVSRGGGLDIPGVTVTGYDYDPADQPVLVEVWSEKSSVDDTMTPLCRSLHINYVPGTGYLSITRIIELLRRAEQHGKPAHVLYVSDYDPAGLNMPRQVARQVQFWRETLGITAGITLHPIVLTAEQVAAYDLPQAPGSGNVELDALIALHPGALETVIREAVERWRDPGISELLSDTEDEALEGADGQWEDATADVRDSVERIHGEAAEVAERHEQRLRQVAAAARDTTAPFRRRLAAIISEVNTALEPHRRQAAAIQEEAQAELEPFQAGLEEAQARYEQIAARFSPELPERPEAECTADRGDLLYDSDRDWLDQLNMFRASKGQPPLEDGSYEGCDFKPWQVVYDSLTSGNGSDGIGDLADSQRADLLRALGRAGYRAMDIATMTGIPYTTVRCYVKGSTTVTMTCRREACGKTFTGRSNARYCSTACSKAAYRERTA